MVNKFKQSNGDRYNNKKVGKSNLKYITRGNYYGKLKDIEYVSEAMILVFQCYVASEYFGGTVPLRVYVPTEMENRLLNQITIGMDYFVITAPYRIEFKKKYQHRVDLLLNIFEEII